MGAVMLHRVILAGVSVCVLGLTFGLEQSAHATWFESATGQPVHVTPRDTGGPHNEALADHAVFGGHDLYWDNTCHTWRDSANGREVHVTPRDTGGPHNEALADRGVFGGHDVYWSPCPPPQTASSTGLYLGGELAQVGFGGTVLMPHVEVGWMGTGTGGGVAATFTPAQLLPTLEIDVPLTTINLGPAPAIIGISGNLMFPTGATSSRGVSAGGFTGTETFQQGFAGSAFLNATVPVVSHQGLDELIGDLALILGAGVGVNEYKAAAIFPGAGDNFSVTHTDVVPAFQAGVRISVPPSVNFLPGAGLSVFVTDFLPGSNVTMPGGNTISFGTAKAANTVSITSKITVPLGIPPRPLWSLH